ncbi:uncharacterized protein ACA1_337300 [Acanthamoeba castellanii str. Neff]|uniref:Uncharacterized protein n=1 Tax=Acanthamoeba castellanii (strain ATCC 30010 / Neff) TaxID=1257118 RepID=L8H9L2_ACACF|nr:uncharacterized protein ACA1_337300 [Acanthamoeba castellanii str. Neff]ELR21880.1 hypothetical protein ACA1_337300 [Acanthamoeba castellanii str. Neff]
MEGFSGLSVSSGPEAAEGQDALVALVELLNSGVVLPGVLSEWAVMKAVTKGGGKPALWSKPKVLFKQLLTFLGHGYDDSEFAPVVAYALAGVAMKWMSVQLAATMRSAVALLSGLERWYGLPTVEALEKGECASDFWLCIGKEVARLRSKANSLVDLNELWHSSLRQDLHNYIDLFPLVKYKVLCNQLNHYKSNKITQQAAAVVAAVPMGPSLAKQLATLTEAVV